MSSSIGHGPGESLSDAATCSTVDKTAKGLYVGKRVLVTGGSGFLGSHLCRALAMAGAEVHAVGRTPPPAVVERIRWHTADLSHIASAEEALRLSNADIVFHVAGYAAGSREVDLVLPSMQGEFVPTINMLTAVTKRGTGRLVLAGSLEEPVTEPMVPSSPYAAAKWACTGFSRMFHLLYATPVVMTRPFMTYGPRQRSNKLVPHVIRSLLRGEAPRLSSGRRMVDWIYVDDLVRGLLLAGGLPGIEGEELDLGSGRLVSVREVVEQIVHETGSTMRPQFGALPDRVFEVERRANTERTSACLGWQTEISLEDGLRRTVAWYRAQEGGTACAP